jgi:hypothetical protein
MNSPTRQWRSGGARWAEPLTIVELEDRAPVLADDLALAELERRGPDLGDDL